MIVLLDPLMLFGLIGNMEVYGVALAIMGRTMGLRGS